MRNWTRLILLSLTLLVAGCQTTVYRELDGISTLTDHPQFPIAAREAPEFTREALRKIAELEFELERQ
tara:strand:- start:2893 stop:3096 length:204 start_codon:yes stop_codon:yes gene_type:complete